MGRFPGGAGPIRTVVLDPPDRVTRAAAREVAARCAVSGRVSLWHIGVVKEASATETPREARSRVHPVQCRTSKDGVSASTARAADASGDVVRVEL